MFALRLARQADGMEISPNAARPTRNVPERTAASPRAERTRLAIIVVAAVVVLALPTLRGDDVAPLAVRGGLIDHAAVAVSGVPVVYPVGVASFGFLIGYFTASGRMFAVFIGVLLAAATAWAGATAAAVGCVAAVYATTAELFRHIGRQLSPH